MPRLRRRRKLTRLPEGAVFQLRTGHDFFGDGFGEPVDDATLSAAWQALRERAMEEERQHRGSSWPGRPWAWWRFEYQGPPIPQYSMHHWHEASILLDAGELTPEEMARMPELVAKEVKCRTYRATMTGGQEALDSILDLQRRLNAATRKADTP